ncbi:MAG: dihydroorotate dehydrogenase-like protein [Porphyromonadaceae bacterium]|nr:dihydroorotate dehydrogenase-like protein [Porphyromonadaceae bacterium]
MADITTSFVGLKLQSPIIVGSSGLTRSLDKAQKMVEAGAGAIILKSLFEEQIEAYAASMKQESDYMEAAEYIGHYVRSEEVQRYLDTIRQHKSKLSIPVIASVNCYKSDTWVDFAEKMASVGADALEVNIMSLDTDIYSDPTKTERKYVDMVAKLTKVVGIPVIVKLSRYHTSLPALVDLLRAAGASAVTLFNRSYQPDINLDKEELCSGDIFSHAGDFAETLRFTGLITNLVPLIQISASTGIYTWQEVAKSLLAGAQTTQMCTVLYKEGASAISSALTALGMWMDKRGYRSIDELRGRLASVRNVEVSANIYERVQFMKYFGGRGDS